MVYNANTRIIIIINKKWGIVWIAIARQIKLSIALRQSKRNYKIMQYRTGLWISIGIPDKK